MDSRPPWPFEAELSARPPRRIRLTAERKRMLVVVAAALTVTLAGGSWAFLSLPIRDRTPALMLAFLTFVALGGYLAMRFAAFVKLRRDLVRGGSPVEGVVVERRPGPGPRARLTVWYSAEGSEWRIEASAGENVADIGDVLTVLHTPSNPARSLIYRLSGCLAGSPGAPEGGAAV